jgi:hypothetical protein
VAVKEVKVFSFSIAVDVNHKVLITFWQNAELIQSGCNTLHSEIHELTNSIWNKEELPQQWKESDIELIFKNGDKTDCSNYRGISLLPIAYRILLIYLSHKKLRAD